jgi:hypothetical protein
MSFQILSLSLPRLNILIFATDSNQKLYDYEETIIFSCYNVAANGGKCSRH